MTTALLQTTYFGPIQWYQKLCRYDHCIIEQYDSYQKQTYRNRCLIATANGVQALTVPVENEKGEMRNEKCRDWEDILPVRQWLYQTPEQILIKASNGASDFGNKFGQPLICGSVLTF